MSSIEERWKDSEFLPVTPERAKAGNDIRRQLGLPVYPDAPEQTAPVSPEHAHEAEVSGALDEREQSLIQRILNWRRKRAE